MLTTYTMYTVRCTKCGAELKAIVHKDRLIYPSSSSHAPTQEVVVLVDPCSTCRSADKVCRLCGTKKSDENNPLCDACNRDKEAVARTLIKLGA